MNIVDNPYAENEGGAPDLVNLQNENDNLKYRIIEKDGAIKSKEDALNRLQDENKKLVVSQSQSRKVILALEKKCEQSEIIVRDYNDQVNIETIDKFGRIRFHDFKPTISLQIKTLRSRLKEIDQLREKLKEANDKNRIAEWVQRLIKGSQQDTDELLKEGRSTLVSCANHFKMQT